MRCAFTAEDMRHLLLCNEVASGMYWRHKKLFYAVKDAIVKTFGTSDGYDLQYWYDEDFYEPGETHACHKHILERWLLMGRTLHRPTNEFHYVQYERWGVVRRSENFSDLYPLCKNKLKGRKLHSLPYDQELRERRRRDAWESLKYLVRRFGFMLKLPPVEIRSMRENSLLARCFE